MSFVEAMRSLVWTARQCRVWGEGAQTYGVRLGWCPRGEGGEQAGKFGGNGTEGDRICGISPPDKVDGTRGLRVSEGAEREGAAAVFDGGGEGGDEGDATTGGGHLHERGEAGRAPGRLCEAGAVAEGEDLISEAVAVGEEEEFEGGEVRGRGRRVGGEERVVREGCEEEGVVTDECCVVVGETGVAGKDGRVELAALELGEQSHRFLFDPDEAKRREAGSEGRCDIGQKVGSDGRDGSDAEVPGEGVPRLGRDGVEEVCGAEERAGLVNPLGGARNEGNAPVGSVEETKAEGVFDERYLRGE